ncbi:MAG: cytochrome c-type biogenesis protein [Rhizobacter sp.]
MKRLCVLLLLVLFTGVGAAREAVPLAEDAAVEARLNGIADELRCLVCQNESLAASRADLAQDLRREIRGLIKAGKSDAEIIDFLVSRYGDFVRYRPPLKPSTWLLWLGPFVLLALALAGLVLHLRRRRPSAAPLSEADKRLAAAILDGKN